MKTECRACGRVFGGLTGFDDHRAGAYVDTPPDYGRYCRSDADMEARGYHEVGGVWKKQLEESELLRLQSMKRAA